MSANRPSPRRRMPGFTLIELLVTIVMASILMSIAVSSYLSSVRKSRRTEAKTALLDLAGREEQFFSSSNTYSQALADLGYTGGGASTNVGSGYYKVTLSGNTTQFAITAVPVTADQLKDTTCASFTVNNFGAQSSVDNNGADSTASCW